MAKAAKIYVAILVLGIFTGVVIGVVTRVVTGFATGIVWAFEIINAYLPFHLSPDYIPVHRGLNIFYRKE